MKMRHNGSHTWTQTEASSFRTSDWTTQRLAYELAVNMRSGVRSLPAWKMHEKEGGLTWKSFKGQYISNEIGDENALEVSMNDHAPASHCDRCGSFG